MGLVMSVKISPKTLFLKQTIKMLTSNLSTTKIKMEYPIILTSVQAFPALLKITDVLYSMTEIL
jgi:hypothetical protein